MVVAEWHVVSFWGTNNVLKVDSGSSDCTTLVIPKEGNIGITYIMCWEHFWNKKIF